MRAVGLIGLLLALLVVGWTVERQWAAWATPPTWARTEGLPGRPAGDAANARPDAPQPGPRPTVDAVRSQVDAAQEASARRLREAVASEQP